MDDPGLSTPELSLAVYRACFAADGPASLPDYAGSALRGAFGHALKKTVCVTRQSDCKSCLLYRSCAYPYLFETPPPEDSRKMRRYTAAPHPFVFTLPFAQQTRPAARDFELGFSLFGRGNQFLPYVVQALEVAGKGGIGGRRGQGHRFNLTRLEQASGFNDPQWHAIYQPGQSLAPLPPSSPAIPFMPAEIVIHFKSPLRLSRDKHNIGPEPFQFADLFITLMRRLSMLSYFHTDAAHETDFQALAARAREVQFTRKQLAWQDWTRYSSRQKTHIKMGGLMGRVELAMQGLDAFWPYLWLGQWTHVGKGTSMGLGHYRIETAASLPAETPPMT